MDILDKIRELYNTGMYSTYELSSLLDIHRHTLSSILKGTRKPQSRTIRKIADRLEELYNK